MILLTGAAGKTGKAILQVLTKCGKAVKALVFRPDQILTVKTLGAKEVVVGDITDAEIVRSAFQNVDTVYFICPNVHPDEIAIGKLIIESALKAGTKHFVYHSVLHPQIEDMPHHWNKLRVEEYLINSGLPFTILQPTVYMQNILVNWNNIITSGRYQNPYSIESRITYVDLDDLANAAAIILNDSLDNKIQPGHFGATYEIAGMQALSHMEIAAILSQKLNRPVRAEYISTKVWKNKASQSGLGAYQTDALVKMFNYYDRYGLMGNAHSLGMLLNRLPTSFEQFIDRYIHGLTNNTQ
jgi:NAD(P)H dehydrogenase (quinone)